MSTKKQKAVVPDSEIHYTSREVVKVLHTSFNHLKEMRDKGLVVYFKTGRCHFTYPKEQFTLQYIQKQKEQKPKYSLTKK